MIRIEALTKSFRRHKVLDSLSLEVEAGDRIALIGANGAGKTTLIRCLLGEYVFEGTVLVDGRSPRHDRCAVLRGIGFVPQLPPPLKMPVGELVRFAAGVSGTDWARIASVLAQLGLDIKQVEAKPFVKLSGGQKQKILAAIALGRESRLLILDEPTANLDPAARKVLFELLAADPQRPMLISSHRLEEVAGLVNRVIELDRGKAILDERIAVAGSLAERHSCHIVAVRNEAAFASAMTEWGLQGSEERLDWRGTISAADRLRFLAMLARFAGLIETLQLGGEAIQPVNGRSFAAGEDRDVARTSL